MPEIDLKVFRDLSYGLYIISSTDGDRKNAQLVNTVIQVTSEPPRIAVTINNKNYTHELISKSKVFAAMVLSEVVTLPFLGPFGFRSGRDVDKFAKTPHEVGVTGSPIVIENCLSFVEARVVNEIALGTHTIFVGDVVNTGVLRAGSPLTYKYYHENLRGKTPPNAPSFSQEK
jgi:flavin reductase (DIM6/NTAB) family NADH-FMN oxidoreductase RutF